MDRAVAGIAAHIGFYQAYSYICHINPI